MQSENHIHDRTVRYSIPAAQTYRRQSVVQWYLSICGRSQNWKALVTDTLHKIRFLEGIDGKQVAAAFLNTYTLALSETLGRSYGGGVLTFEPGEIRKIRIPMQMASRLDLQMIDCWQRNGEIDKILKYTDTILLRDGLGLSEKEIGLLHDIWEKLHNRRMTRKNQRKRI